MIATNKKKCSKRAAYIKFAIATICYLAFLYWVESWWGLVVVPFIYDVYISKKINWTWWRDSDNWFTRTIMSWVDAIVFALVAIYFLNLFFFQNFVIPSSSLEKTMLTGDYLLVSKVHYGPRIPQTPLTMPLTQHTLPVFNCKSYVEWPQWDYRRVKGLGHVRLNDIVVFNYPAGDTVALNIQNQDYYGTAYSCGYGIWEQRGIVNPVSELLSLEEQREAYRIIYETGSNYIKSNPEFGEVVARPTDRRENYVKRCVGMPGQTLQIIDEVVYLDGKPNPQPENVQFNYDVTFLKDLDADTKKELNITNEELDSYMAGHTLPMTNYVKEQLVKRGFIAPNPQPSASVDSRFLYPLNMKKDWTTQNYGPIWIPKKGENIKLSLENLPIYERPIRIYEGNELAVRDGKIYINGQEADSYTFRLDYYWMMGDNRDNSADSRFWGFVPEDHVVGKPLFVWLSLHPDYGLFNGKIRWERFFKWVGDIK